MLRLVGVAFVGGNPARRQFDRGAIDLSVQEGELRLVLIFGRVVVPDAQLASYCLPAPVIARANTAVKFRC